LLQALKAVSDSWNSKDNSKERQEPKVTQQAFSSDQEEHCIDAPKVCCF
jgi:hypothetical protein